MMEAIFSPASIAVIGGGNDTRKPGGRVVWNLTGGGFTTLAVVNPHDQSVQGLPTFQRIEDLPEPPDLAIISIPAPQVTDAVRRLSALGTRGFIVLSAGFGETDEAGRVLENELRDEVQRAGVHMIGPNSLGVFTTEYVGTFGGPAMTPVPGTIDFVSASGSTAAFIIEAGLDHGLQFASLVSVGNSTTCGVEDVLAYQDDTFEAHPVKTKLLYIEAIRDPNAMLRHAASLRRKGCHVVALKAGTTDVGARAASSHTGAIATRDAAVSALLDKAGVVRVKSGRQMVNAAGLLTCYGPPRGNRVAIVTHAGGPGIILCDELVRRGFTVPSLSPETQARLKRVLLPGSATGNPIDFLAPGTADHLREIFQVLAEREKDNIDAVCVIFGSPGLFDVWPVFQTIIDGAHMLPIPVYPVLPSTRTAATEAAKFRDAGYFYFTNEVELAIAMDQVMRTPAPSAIAEDIAAIDVPAVAAVIDAARARGIRQLEEEQVDAVLKACGFSPPPSQLVDDVARAPHAAAALGFPVVMKGVGLLHKSDHHAVLLNIRGEAEASSAFATLRAIPGVRGVLVQKQIEGVELILGLSREGAFGHLVLVGVGGIFAEVLGDTAFGLAPLRPEEAQRMVGRLRGSKLLDGLRGRPGIDRNSVVEALCRLSALAFHFPAIKEMDINPLMGSGADLWAVDARIELSE